MQCDFGQENLNALADGELSGWQKWRVKRHLSKCIQCQAEFAEIQKLSAQARTWRNVEPPAKLKRRIAAVVFEQTPIVQNSPSFTHRKAFLKPVLITASLFFCFSCHRHNLVWNYQRGQSYFGYSRESCHCP